MSDFLLHDLYVLHGELILFLAPYELSDCFNFVIHHLRGETRIGSQEDRLVHDLIGAGHFTYNPERVRSIFAELDKNRLAKEIAPEEHPIADFLGIEMTCQIGMGEGYRGLHPQHEAEPGTSGCATG